MASEDSKVKAISECFIRPKYELEEANITPTRRCYNLLAGDLYMLSMHYMQKGFLFHKPTTPSNFNINTFLDKMKHSFSCALTYYHPLAGRFETVKYQDEQSCSIYVDPDKGPGARFIHASLLGTCVSVDHIASYDPLVLPVVRSLFDLGEAGVVNYDGHTRPLVTLQVTELEDGVFVGLTMNHSIADGTSFLHFINSLSQIFNSLDDKMKMTAKISNEPTFKPFLPDGCSPIQKLPYLELPDDLINRDDVDPLLQERVFRFSSSIIAKLKEQANSENGSEEREISSFQALAAFVWISITRARNLPKEEMTICLIAMNTRPRLNPPLSSDYFWKMTQGVIVIRKTGELLENGLGWVSMQLHQAITAHDVLGYLKANMEKPFVLQRNAKNETPQKQSMVVFAGSARFDMYGPEFGLGKAVSVPTGYAGKADGKVTANTGRQGEGGVEIQVCLLPDHVLSLASDKEFMDFVS